MASSSSGGRGLSFSIRAPSPRADRSGRSGADDDVLQILVVADCSGRGARGVVESLAGRRASAIRIEQLDGVMQAWRARVRTPLFDDAGEPFWFAPASLDDFHPDHLLRSAAPLVELAALRRAIATDAGAAARLSALLEAARSAGGTPASAGSSEGVGTHAGATARVESPSESGSDMLTRLLGSAPASAQPVPAQPVPASRAAGKVDIDRFIRAIVDGAGADVSATHSKSPVPGRPVSGSPVPSGPRLSGEALAALAAAAEAELGQRLRLLLATPAVRALEATWRGIDGLCRHNPDEMLVRVSVLDASFEEVAADLGEFTALLAAVAPGVLLIDHQFTPASEPLSTLSMLLDTCREREISVLAGAHPHLAGCAHFNEVSEPDTNDVDTLEVERAAWAEVLAARQRGARLGLALPRFLLRQPYGAAGEPIEHFPFEEILDVSEHEAFSWGNGAYLLARALGIQHVGGRGVHPDGSIDVRELPVVYLEEGALGSEESRVKPNAEAWLSERALGRLRAAGFSVLLGWRDTDRVRVYP
jgi:type VI secretion system protein ImpC